MKKLIYIFTNPAMPKLIKIGQTSNLEQELNGLSFQTGVPEPFECYYCCEVEDGANIKETIHDFLGDYRVSPEKDFFKFSPEKVKKILTLPISEQKKIIVKEKTRKVKFNFSMLDIPIGSTLTFFNDKTKIEDKAKVAIVTGDREIEFEGKRGAVSPIALYALQKYFGGNYEALQGPRYWMFNDETLLDRRERMGNE